MWEASGVFGCGWQVCHSPSHWFSFRHPVLDKRVKVDCGGLVRTNFPPCFDRIHQRALLLNGKEVRYYGGVKEWTETFSHSIRSLCATCVLIIPVPHLKPHTSKDCKFQTSYRRYNRYVNRPVVGFSLCVCYQPIVQPTSSVQMSCGFCAQLFFLFFF